MSSIFTKIIKREIPAEIIYEDERVIAFLDIHPINPGHTLVVPKREIAEFHQLDDALYQHTMRVVRDIACRLKEEFKPPRVGVLIKGFEVDHTHVHVVPLHHHEDIRAEMTNETNKESDPEALKVIRERLTS